ncbi:MAG: hypothetical protein WB779_04675 [Ignavibacteriaceae bacterium]|jgi:hypothetical protein
MELKNLNFDKRMKRKNFFISLVAGVAGYFALRSLPFKLFSKKINSNKAEKTNSRVKVNPLAVSRKNIGGNNV